MSDLMQEAHLTDHPSTDPIEADALHPASTGSVSNQTPQPLEPQERNQGFWLTNDLLFNFQRCKRRAFLDVYDDDAQRDPPSDYLLKLRQDSLAHQLDILSDPPVQPARYPSRQWEAGAQATLSLMQQGVERISRGVLIVQRDDGVRLVSTPDLLVKQPGWSYFGDWHYVPYEIKLGKRPKIDYQIIAAFHAHVLAAVQGVMPETSWLMLRQRGPYDVDLNDMLPRLFEVLEDCVETLLSQQEPEVFISHNRCNLCHWFSHCYGLAQADEHLSLLPGVTPSRYVQLKELDLITVEALATIPPETLEMLPGFGTQVAHKLVQQAQSKLSNQAIAHHLPTSAAAHVFSFTQRPAAAVELYFDIEAAPEQNLVYLHGVLVVDHHDQTEQFYPLLADHPDHEETIWHQLLELIYSYPDAPIFHFCPYEVQTMKRLSERYNTPFSQIEPLLDRFVDLHEWVTKTVTLPVESYALKPIARWVGFDWRDQDANGAQSIYWYSQWLMTGDRHYLDSILRYNEDDCRATYRVKEWLVNFLSQP